MVEVFLEVFPEAFQDQEVEVIQVVEVSQLEIKAVTRQETQKWGSPGGGPAGGPGDGGLMQPFFANGGRGVFLPGDRAIWELPQLGDVDATISPIQLGDWLSLVSSMMSDLSQASGVWWTAVVRESEAWYGRWQRSGPVVRAQIQPSLSRELSDPRFSRLENRAISMLMKAIPEAARQEVISSRDMSSVNILFRLLILFQPGGLKERSMPLSFLSNPGAADGPAEGVAILRKWHRWINRAQSMGATLPDCSILMTGLDHLAASMLQGYPTIAFRLNLIRTEHRLDHVPQLPTVMIYARSLQAELEQAAISPLPETMSPKKQRVARIDHGQTTKGVEPKGGDPKGTCPKGGDKAGKGGKPENTSNAAQDTSAKAKGKTKNQDNQASPQGGVSPSAQASASRKPLCTFYMSDSGCKHGRACQYSHDQAQAAAQATRKGLKCWTCGSIHHRKQDCQAPGGTKGPKTETQQQPSQTGKGSGNIPKTTAAQPMATTPAQTQQQATAGPKVASLTPDQILVEAAAKLQHMRLSVLTLLPNGSSTLSLQGGYPVHPDLRKESVVYPVHPDLRKESVAVEAILAAASSKEPFSGLADNVGEPPHQADDVGLLDGGATNPLRMGTAEELEQARPVTVQLAAGTCDLWLSSTRVLLSAQPVLTIVPLGTMSRELRCSIQWDDGLAGTATYPDD